MNIVIFLKYYLIYHHFYIKILEYQLSGGNIMLFLNDFAKLLKKLHDFIARKSNHMNDKVLHFLVLGFTGLIIFALTYPMFKHFDKKNNPKAMAAIYTFATTMVLTVAMAFILDVSNLIFIPFIFGFILFLFSYQIFKDLDKKDETSKITHYFVTTVIVCFAFSIEICQGFTETGNLEVADAIFGIAGYIMMFYILYIIVTLIKLIFYRKGSESKKDH